MQKALKTLRFQGFLAFYTEGGILSTSFKDLPFVFPKATPH
jgi:hypothetical protein